MKFRDKKGRFLKGSHVKTEFKKGNLVWNKGLTKETDERVKNISRIVSQKLKGKILSLETIEKIRKKHLGMKRPPRTEDWKRKQSESHKGHISKRKGLNLEEEYGENRANELRKKISLGQKERWKDKDYREKQVSKLKNRVLTKQWKEKIRIANLGERNPFYGKKHNLDTKEKIVQTKIKNGTIYFGEKHPNWLGGISFEPYGIEFNKSFKEAIRQRDNFTCLKCNLFEDNSIKLYGRKLIVHHIDYIKNNTYKENCCALCLRCNAEVNFNRVHWTKFFQSLLSERYNYQYSENNEKKINLMEVKNGDSQSEKVS